MTDRTKFIGASEIAALFGCDPYGRTPLQLYLEKTGQAPANGDNKMMRRGRILEPAVAAAVQEENPEWRIWAANDHWSYGQLGATPDYLMEAPPEKRVPLETKVISPTSFETNWQDGPPLGYALQVLQQAMLLESPHGYIGCLVTTFDYPVYTFKIPRHAELEKQIIDKAAAFWAAVESKCPPEPNLELDSAALTLLYPRPTKPAIDLTSDNVGRAMLENRRDVMDSIKALEETKDKIDSMLKILIGDHEAALFDGWRITWKEETKHYKAKEAYESTSRVLRVFKTKENGT